MSKRVQSFASKSSSLFLSTTSFEKGNAMNTRKRTRSVLTLATVAAATLTFMATSANAATTFFTDLDYDSYNDAANANISPFASTFGSLTSFDGGSPGGSAVGPTYHDFRGLSATATAGQTYFFLEDYQDGLANSPGVTYGVGGGPRTDNGRNGSANAGANTDSVDEDNGTVDDDRTTNPLGVYRHNPATLTITFDAIALGGLPTHVGWVEAQASATTNGIVEFFAADGVTSLGSTSWGVIPGPTSPDIFVGAMDAGGISRIELSRSNGSDLQVEFDHLQYGRVGAPANGTAPEPSTLILAALGFVGLLGTRRRRRR